MPFSTALRRRGSGQPALVFAYCSTGSPHDAYFFRRPELMVAGQVKAPRLELVNEDLVRSHVHAIWLRAVDKSLGRSLADILDVSGQEPTLDLLPEVADDLVLFAVTEKRTPAESPRMMMTPKSASARRLITGGLLAVVPPEKRGRRSRSAAASQRPGKAGPCGSAARHGRSAPGGKTCG